MIVFWLKYLAQWFHHAGADVGSLTRAQRLAREDALAAAQGGVRRFSEGTRPVIRWIKGEGLDDEVTRAAIGQATRLFGPAVDYCLCTNGIDAARVRAILAWAEQPVEWWPLSELDNPSLANHLSGAGCPPRRYGYWWKWFPERARADAPEWILDGDMVVTARPPWFEDWVRGRDTPRVAQDDRAPAARMYGNYVAHTNPGLRLYSGLVSLPPGLRYMDKVSGILALQPLAKRHDGRRDMCEQGVIAAALQGFDPKPIPLYEFPFARAYEKHIDYGLQGDQGVAWGYHFSYAFRRANPHFKRLTANGVIYSRAEPDPLERFGWLGNTGQWGVPGWTMPDGCARAVLKLAGAFASRPVLEIGTSRGRIAAMLATLGCRVTTVDHQDRGAAQNLAGLPVRVIRDDAEHFLRETRETFDLIFIDLHGNAPADWQRLAEPLLLRLNPGGTMILNNAALHNIFEWRHEAGVRWFLDRLPQGWPVRTLTREPPGVVAVSRP